LNVRAAHSGRFDPDENLIGCDFRSLDFFQDQRLFVAMHSCCEHLYLSFPLEAVISVKVFKA
jgi:hypothetical protein